MCSSVRVLVSVSWGVSMSGRKSAGANGSLVPLRVRSGELWESALIQSAARGCVGWYARPCEQGRVRGECASLTGGGTYEERR